MNMCVILNGRRDTAVWIHKLKIIMNGNKEREIITYSSFNWDLIFKWQIWYTEIVNLLQFTINLLKAYRQHQFTLQLVCENRLCLGVSLHVFSWGQQHPTCEWAMFCKLQTSSNLRDKNLTELSPVIQTALNK